MRTQQLIWHDMESQIKWTDEWCGIWASSYYIAKHNNGFPLVGKFRTYTDESDIVFESGEYVYQLQDLKEWAEL